MADSDRLRWDSVYSARNSVVEPALPGVFGEHGELFPHNGTALEIACGTGAASVWLAQRGLAVHAVDVSQRAIEHARALAEQRCVSVRFDAVDLDAGLPSGDPAEVVLCHKFRDPDLYSQMADRLKPGGLLAICVLSEVGAAPGRFRAVPGELRAAFAELDELAAGESDGQAWLLARRR